MIEVIQKLLMKHKSVLAYLFFGVCTTVVNIVVYYLCADIVGLSTATSTVIAWFLAVVFAFLTNKSWVFGSSSWDRRTLTREFVSFTICRVATGVLDLAIMVVTVDWFHWNGLVMKVLSNVLVIVLNYVASKLIIFKHGDY